MIYTGVGSRETPQDIYILMSKIAQKLSEMGYTLRSGGADGADLAFESGATKKEIYLPWKGFNDSNSQLYNIPDEAFEIASRIHPAWDKLKQGGKKLHARNILQVLGMTLDNPSKFLICWTPKGKDTGGTRTAIVLAREYNIPIINLAIHSSKEIRKYV